MKYFFIILLCLLPIFNLVAQTAIQPAAGNGDAETPYQITIWENLYWLSQNSALWDKHFIQMNDIDFSEAVPAINTWDGNKGFKPIGSRRTGFSGSYDGQGHIIDWLFINRSGNQDNNIGLFGYTENATISNLGITNVDISGRDNTGGLIGSNNGSSSISECFFTGSVNGDQYVGGLVGSNNGNSSISECFSTGSVNGTQRVGGLVGENAGDISNSYSSANVSASGNFVGGLAGRNNGVISNCYSIGTVAGNNQIGGLVGSNGNTVTDSYWNTETSGITTSAGGTGKVTDDMLTIFEDWDSEVWSVDEGFTYPFLNSQAEPTDSNIPPRPITPDPAGPRNKYRKTFGPQSNSKTAIFTAHEEDDGSAVITFVYTTSSAHSSVQDFPYPDTFVAYYGFHFANNTVLETGQTFELQFPELPYHIWYKYNGIDWTVIPSSLISGPNPPNFTYLLNVQDLLNGTRDTVYNIEFLADRDGGDTPLPVELSSFTSTLTPDTTVKLSWRAETETELLGYHIYCSLSNEVMDAFRINPELIMAQNTSTAIDYSFIDHGVHTNHLYYYWLQAIDMDLTHEYYGPIAVLVTDQEFGNSLPPARSTELLSAFPNPFNPSTNIRFSLDRPAIVSISVYNSKGRLVRRLADNETYAPGYHSLLWDGRDSTGKPVASGIYFYTMKTDKDYQGIKMMLLLK